ncbi:MAG TPA: hypothetical protein VFE46_04935 [Pirellulales bacterium]|jgi:hypothetical protein|nr:hypothetical protein [Pirellulales bacterium]
MEDEDFVVTLPLFMVVDESKGISPLKCVSEEDENIRGIAIFTEELLAERARDSQSPLAQIWPIPAKSNVDFHIQSMRNGGFRYVAIDPYEESGRSTRFLTLEQFKRANGL